MWLAYANVKVNASGVGKGVKCKKWVYSYFKVSFPFGWTLALFYCFIKIILWLMYLYFFLVSDYFIIIDFFLIWNY